MRVEHISKDLVSIIIPCYNTGEFVGDAIESALDQSYEPKEVIVIDDGSTDDSLQVIQSYDDQIVWRSGPNKGASSARNTGIDLAKGKFVKFLDADDVLVEGVIEKQIRQIHNLGIRSIVFGDIKVLNEERGKECVMYYSDIEGSKTDRIKYLLRNNIQTSAPLHRMHLLKEVGGFNEGLPRAQEYDLHLRLCLNDVNFEYESGICSCVRDHSSPSRITNQDIFDNDPSLRKRRILYMVSMFEKEFGELPPEGIRKFLARDLWRGGRRALRLGHNELARSYFSEARSLHSSQCVVGSVWYRLAESLCGPIVAEKIGELTM